MIAAMRSGSPFALRFFATDGTAIRYRPRVFKSRCESLAIHGDRSDTVRMDLFLIRHAKATALRLVWQVIDSPAEFKWVLRPGMKRPSKDLKDAG